MTTLTKLSQLTADYEVQWRADGSRIWSLCHDANRISKGAADAYVSRQKYNGCFRVFYRIVKVA
jgi:hypothetical protein